MNNEIAGCFLRSDRLYHADARNTLTEARAWELIDNLLVFDDFAKVRMMIELLEGFNGLLGNQKDVEKLVNILDDAVRQIFVYTPHFQNALCYYLVHELGCADVWKRDDEQEVAPASVQPVNAESTKGGQQ